MNCHSPALRLMLALALALPLALLIVPESATQLLANERVTVTTEHYELTSAGSQEEAKDWGRMLEAAWPQFTEFFGAAPKLRKGDKLRVAVYETDAPWREAIVAGGGVAPSSGGYYCPVAKTAYVKRQPSAWYTRTLLLHESTHQFHYLARTGNDALEANWYVEGIAEHLGSHTWDAKTLTIGVTPPVSLEDRAGAALTTLAEPGFSLPDLVEADAADRPTAMFLVRFLKETQAKKFAAMTRKLDRGSILKSKQFQRTFGKPDALVAKWKEWLAEQQETFDSVTVEWDSLGARRVLGVGPAVSLCRTSGDALVIAARLTRHGKRPLRAGLLLSVTSRSEFVAAFVDERSDRPRLDVAQLRGGKWRTLKSVDLDASGQGDWFLTASRSDADALISVGRLSPPGTKDTKLFTPRELAPIPLPAGAPTQALGLAVDNCMVEFSRITVTSRE